MTYSLLKKVTETVLSALDCSERSTMAQIGLRLTTKERNMEFLMKHGWGADKKTWMY